MLENWSGANSRLGISVSDLYRAKIRLGEFKAVYSTCMLSTSVAFFCISTNQLVRQFPWVATGNLARNHVGTEYVIIPSVLSVYGSCHDTVCPSIHPSHWTIITCKVTPPGSHIFRWPRSRESYRYGSCHDTAAVEMLQPQRTQVN